MNNDFSVLTIAPMFSDIFNQTSGELGDEFPIKFSVKDDVGENIDGTFTFSVSPGYTLKSSGSIIDGETESIPVSLGSVGFNEYKFTALKTDENIPFVLKGKYYVKGKLLWNYRFYVQNKLYWCKIKIVGVHFDIPFELKLKVNIPNTLDSVFTFNQNGECIIARDKPFNATSVYLELISNTDDFYLSTECSSEVVV